MTTQVQGGSDIATRICAWLKPYRAAFFALATLCGVSSPAQTVTYIHNDPFGSPVMATDANGNVVWKETYKPYGERVNNSPAAIDNSIGFTGKSFDASTGLSYMGARYYDPVLGRFLGVDPKEVHPGDVHSFNRYAYANNNPYKFVDPDGRQPALFFEVGVSALLVGGAYYAIQPPEKQQALRISLGRAWDHILHSDTNANESVRPASNQDETNGPELPTGLVGTQDKDARQQGNRHNSGPLDPVSGGTGDAQQDFDHLTGGKHAPAPTGSSYPPGAQVGENGVVLRPGKGSIGPRIDVPSNGSKPHETLHYPPGS
jgi:RHS repeat-associated protein